MSVEAIIHNATFQPDKWRADLSPALLQTFSVISPPFSRMPKPNVMLVDEIAANTCPSENQIRDRHDDFFWFAFCLRMAATWSFVLCLSVRTRAWSRVMTSLVAVLLLAKFGDGLYSILQESFGSFVASYMIALEANPIMTKSFTAGVIQSFGDVLAQFVEFAMKDETITSITLDQQDFSTRRNSKCFERIRGYNPRRGLSMFADGIFVSGPLMHMSYEIFEEILPTTTVVQNSSQATIAAIVHVIADSFVLDSFFVAFTFLSTGLMEGVHRHRLYSQFKTDCGSALVASWATSAVLCPIQFYFFRYLPLNLRVLSINCIDLVWSAVQSFMSHRNRHQY